jgi:hypothetical protein
MIEIWRVEGGLTAPRVGVGEFAQIPQEKTNFVEKTYFNLSVRSPGFAPRLQYH